MKNSIASLIALALVMGLSCTPGEENSAELGEEPPGGEDGLPVLSGPVWQWQQTLMGNDDRFVPVKPGDYTVQFLSDGTLSVLADSRQLGGTYTLEGRRLSIELGPHTMVAYPEGSLGSQFTSNLGAANSHFFEGEDLLIELMYDSGTMRLAQETPDLFESVWIVTGYSDGQGGVTSTLEDTELTVEFAQDGTITGSSGCNTYRGNVETDGRSITLGPLSTTRMFCHEPEGIMAQEEAYLAALSTAATLELAGASLEMRTAEGATVASFQLAGHTEVR